jgi:Fe-S-cluster-containing dehydrogenase component
MGQIGFIFDVNKCTGCSACQLACTIENQVSPQIVWRQINTFNPSKFPGIPVFHHSLACNHCIDPPCMAHCPALAYSKDPRTGAVTIDDVKCIGCKYCSWACPYDAPQFNVSLGVVEKCTFCAHRLDVGLAPACVALCPTGALQVGEYTLRGEPETVEGFPSNGARPAIEFVPLEESRIHPEAVEAEDVSLEKVDLRAIALFDKPPSKVTLRSEWTLVGFTFMAALLVGLLTAGVLGSFHMNPILFAGAGMSLMAMSTIHLGRWRRAPRAILNLRRSWLSREVVLFPIFICFGTWYFLAGGGRTIGWLAVGIGFAALFSIDRVYSITKTKGLGLHSAQVVLTGLLFASIATGFYYYLPAGVLLGAKAVLYGVRKLAFARNGRNPRLYLASVRLVCGCGLPALIWLAGLSSLHVAAVVLVGLGELIDRCEYYSELDVQTPRGEMERELVRRLTPSKKAG